MTKVGVYAVLRLGTLLQEYETLGAACFFTGLATLATATIGMLAAKHLARLVAYSVLVSTGILFAALGLRIEALTAPILFYIIVSALTTCTFFLLTGMTDRTRTDRPVRLAGRRPRARPRVRRLRDQGAVRVLRPTRMRASRSPRRWPSSA